MAVDEATGSLNDELLAIFAGERLENTYSIWNRVREQPPVLPVGPIVLITRYDDVKAALADRERYSAKLHLVGNRAEQIVASLSPDAADMWREMAMYEFRQMSRSDGEEHDRLRRIAHRFFTPRVTKSMQDQIKLIIDDLFADAEAAGGVYDQKAFAQQIAARVMAYVIGSPDLDTPKLINWANALGRWLGTHDEQRIREAYVARVEFNDYIENVIIAGHRRNPGTNELVAALMDAEGEENLSTGEMIAMVSNILFAGVETTTVLLSSGLLELMRHRDQWEAICADPSKVEPAVEEMFRYFAPVQWTPRVAIVDFEQDGVEIRTGQTVMAVLATANRDPSVFDEPDVFDIDRVGPPHLGLGFGARFCLGSSLVRTEARVFFTTLAERYPDVELGTDPDELDWSGSNPIMRSVSALPVRLGPQGR
jgi:cytochrome P450